jgi:hypothetical protein
MKKSPGKQSGSGGGARSRPVTHRGGSPNTRKIDPGAVSQIGNMKGSHVMGNGGREVQRPSQPIVQGTPRAPVPMGNEVAKNVGRGSPGAGRTVHASGSQGQHGAPVQGSSPAPRDILSEFGPESRRG